MCQVIVYSLKFKRKLHVSKKTKQNKTKTKKKWSDRLYKCQFLKKDATDVIKNI